MNAFNVLDMGEGHNLKKDFFLKNFGCQIIKTIFLLKDFDVQTLKTIFFLRFLK